MTKAVFFLRHQKLTRSLKKFILDYEESLASDVFESFLASLSNELKSASSDLFQWPSGPHRALRLHELVDIEIAQSTTIESSCQKGCSACCNLEVEITNYEADILSKIVNDGLVIDQDRLQKQSERSLQDPQWREGARTPLNRCVFLNDQGSCRVYNSRPVMCRRHSVTSPAKNCESLDAKIVLRYFPKVDLLISASNEDPQIEVGPLAKMLRKNPHLS